MIKKTMGFKAFLQLIGLCISLLIFSSVAFAEKLDSRWEYLGTYGGDMFYYDTQTLEYDSTNRIAKYWILQMNPKTKRKMESLNELYFKTKRIRMTQLAYYENNQKMIINDFNGTDVYISPDAPSVPMINKIASRLHIAPLYKENPNRWKLIHSNHERGLYFAMDTFRGNPAISKYAVWVKWKYTDSSKDGTSLYLVDFADQTICSSAPNNKKKHRPIPGSDEEYIFKAVKVIKEALETGKIVSTKY